jgi:hypothetical protein
VVIAPIPGRCAIRVRRRGHAREQRAVLAGQHEHVLLVRAAEAHLDLDAGQRGQRLAQLLLDLLLADAAALAARRHVDRQRRLAHLGGAARRKGSLPVAPPPMAV